MWSKIPSPDTTITFVSLEGLYLDDFQSKHSGTEDLTFIMHSFFSGYQRKNKCSPISDSHFEFDSVGLKLIDCISIYDYNENYSRNDALNEAVLLDCWIDTDALVIKYRGGTDVILGTIRKKAQLGSSNCTFVPK